MTVSWGILIIGALPVRISSDTTFRACKLSFQAAPGNLGSIKIGGSPALTPTNTTPGTYLDCAVGLNADGSLEAGPMWTVESHEDSNTIYVANYFVHGTTPGDLVMYEYHQD